MNTRDLFSGSGILLTDADIQEFIKIYQQEFKEELSVADARAMASGLLELFSLLVKPLSTKTKGSEYPDSEAAIREK